MLWVRRGGRWSLLLGRYFFEIGVAAAASGIGLGRWFWIPLPFGWRDDRMGPVRGVVVMSQQRHG
jgi:hypothetical protein